MFGFGKGAQRSAWAALAAQLGGSYRPSEGFLNPTAERIEVTIEDVPVVVETYEVTAARNTAFGGPSKQPFTRLTARYVHGPGPRLRLYDRGAAAAQAMIPGLVDQAIDPGFDARYLVRAESGALARRLWSDDARRRMAMFTQATVRSDADKLELIQPGVWMRFEMMRDGIQLVALLAARDLYGSEQLRAVRGAVFEHPRAVLDTGVRVEIRAELVDDQLVMVARSSEHSPVSPCSIEIASGNLVDAAAGSLLSPAAHIALRGVGTGVLAVTSEGTSFTWHELEVVPERLRAGAELLGAMANAVTAGYR